MSEKLPYCIRCGRPHIGRCGRMDAPRWSHVPCTSCGAEVREPCKSATGRVTTTHTPRMYAWWEQASKWMAAARTVTEEMP